MRSCCARRTRMRVSASPMSRRCGRCPACGCVLTAAEVADLGPLPTPGGIPATADGRAALSDPGAGRGAPRRRPVAFVVADTLEPAKDAAEAIRSTGSRCRRHRRRGRAQARRAAGLAGPAGQSRLRDRARRRKATEAAFARRARIVAIEIVNHRLVDQLHGDARRRRRVRRRRATRSPWAPRAATASATSSPRTSCKLPPDKMRVITPDVGGGFGTKLFLLPRISAGGDRGASARPPVKWIGDRTEHFLGDSQGRDNITVAEMAMDDNGRFLALARRPRRRHGRLSVALRALHPQARRRHADRRLRHPGRLCALAAASTPIPCRSTPIAAPAGPRPPI